MPAACSLVADIGGTNTRVALARGETLDPGSVRRYANRQATDLAGILHRYLDETGTERGRVTGVCVAAAGPVRDGVADLTNLAWRVDHTTLARVLTAQKVAVLNDLQAQGYAISRLAPGMQKVVKPGPEQPPAARRLVVGIGTGFNAAPVHTTGTGRVVPPSECGHITLPVRDRESAHLARALQERHGFAAVEDALSGRGIGAIHRTLHKTGLCAAEVMAALEAGDPSAEATAALFVRLLGHVLGDLALIHLPFGGLYLVGGVSRAFTPHLNRFGLAEAMRDKGRFGPFLDQFGVSVIIDDYAALTGCATHLAHL
ncbi:MAG: ROK family protein [Rhodobacteraceae bacterium]|nr:ROK family protein [Paracoccaceae bacterium]